MALSASSVLHYWTARYGSIPVIGGKPTHARSSAGRWVDQQGSLQSAIVNTPRFNWATLASERRQVLSLEQARTNVLTNSEDFTSGWSLSNVSTLANTIIAPDGTVTADRLVATASTFTTVNRTVVAVGTAVSFSFFVKKYSGAAGASHGGNIGIRNQTTATDLSFGNVNFDTGAVTGAIVATPLGNGWYRLSVSVTAGVNNGDTIVVYAGFSGGPVTAGDGAYFWGAQVEFSAAPSAYIPTAGASVTRAADSIYWDFNQVPQAMMVYYRFVERGTGLQTSGNPGAWSLTDASDSNARLLSYFPATAGGYRILHETAGGQVFSTLAALPSYGDVVEHVVRLNANGSVDLTQSINGAAVSSTATSAALALAASWAAPRLWLNSLGGPLVAAEGVSDHAELKFVKLADVVAGTSQGWMDELRAFELGPNGAVL